METQPEGIPSYLKKGCKKCYRVGAVFTPFLKFVKCKGVILIKFSRDRSIIIFSLGLSLDLRPLIFRDSLIFLL